MNILLVEPDFPIAQKSRNHSNFLPIGLLKIGAYHKSGGDNVQLLRGNKPKQFVKFNPVVIKVTSLFSYWSQHVVDSVRYYRNLFPSAKIEVGGIFASLMPEKCKELTGCDEVIPGLYKNGIAEEMDADYSLLDVDLEYQIIHASRGCFRKCSFCGTWKIEPELTYKLSVINLIKKNKIVFYDNNLLANPFIENILEELTDYKLNKRAVYSESQSGLDGRILLKKPYVAEKLKKARFLNPRIAWDGRAAHHKIIKKQIDILKKAGYKANRNDADIFIFMLFNHDLRYLEFSRKLEYCRRWGVLVIDCRYRPLDFLADGYNPRLKKQAENEYYIHKGWKDWQIRRSRKRVRRQNIAIRLGLPNNRYIEGVERGYVRIK